VTRQLGWAAFIGSDSSVAAMRFAPVQLEMHRPRR